MGNCMLNRLSSTSIDFITYVHNRGISSRRRDVLARVLVEVIPLNQSVLDVGAGDGKLAEALVARRPDLSINGIDIRPAEGSRVPVIEYDGTKIPYDDNTWDVCMANDVLHHCSDPIAILSEICRVSRRFVLLKDHIADTWVDYQVLRLMDWFGNRGYGTPLPYNFLSGLEWDDAYVKLGLRQMVTRRELSLYPPPLTWLFDRNLHFVSLLEVGVDR